MFPGMSGPGARPERGRLVRPGNEPAQAQRPQRRPEQGLAGPVGGLPLRVAICEGGEEAEEGGGGQGGGQGGGGEGGGGRGAVQHQGSHCQAGCQGAGNPAGNLEQL